MPQPPYQLVKECRICGNPDLEPVLSLGTQVLTGVFPKRPDQAVSAGPLELAKCSEDAAGRTCGLLQLQHSFNPDEMYCAGYGYRSGINQTMTRHLHEIVESIRSLVKLQPGDVVLDIGSNDATLLKAYPGQNFSLIGIDPSAVNFRQYYPAHVQLITDFFSAHTFQSTMGTRKAKIVTSIAMFYDLPAPLEFMRDVRSILADDGVWVFEQSYMPSMLAQNAYDTVCQEHVEYYGLRQIKWMADRAGLKILDVELNDTNGGSFRVTVAPEGTPYSARADRVATLLTREQQLGLSTLAPYRAFRENVFRHRDDLRRWLTQSRARGKITLGYGASTKGNVILQFCGITPADVPAIAERNTNKYGCFTPGTLIPIISEAEARARNPHCFLALPWHFREEFLKREQAYLTGGGRFLFPLPRIEVVGL